MQRINYSYAPSNTSIAELTCYRFWYRVFCLYLLFHEVGFARGPSLAFLCLPRHSRQPLYRASLPHFVCIVYTIFTLLTNSEENTI